MSLGRVLSNLVYRRRDPTRFWRRDDSRLIVDLDGCALAGVKIGGPYDGLSCLGPADCARSAIRGSPQWGKLGLWVMLDEGALDGFTILFSESIKGWRGYPGEFRVGGKKVAISGGMSESVVRSLVGAPFARGVVVDEDYIVLFYEYAIGEVQYSFGKNDSLESIEVFVDRELASADVRDGYGITCAWPYAEK